MQPPGAAALTPRLPPSVMIRVDRPGISAKHGLRRKTSETFLLNSSRIPAGNGKGTNHKRGEAATAQSSSAGSAPHRVQGAGTETKQPREGAERPAVRCRIGKRMCQHGCWRTVCPAPILAPAAREGGDSRSRNATGAKRTPEGTRCRLRQVPEKRRAISKAGKRGGTSRRGGKNLRAHHLDMPRLAGVRRGHLDLDVAPQLGEKREKPVGREAIEAPSE